MPTAALAALPAALSARTAAPLRLALASTRAAATCASTTRAAAPLHLALASSTRAATLREECSNPSSETALSAADGQTLYATRNSHCFRVAIGSMIDSVHVGKDDVSACPDATYTGNNYYINGIYSSSQSSTSGEQEYTNGTNNGGCHKGRARQSTLVLDVLSSAQGSLSIDVKQPESCVYDITLSGGIEDFGLDPCP